jgi:hypothetical protein
LIATCYVLAEREIGALGWLGMLAGAALSVLCFSHA